METVSWRGSPTARKPERGGTRGRRLAQYRETRPQRVGGRRKVSARRAHPQERCRQEKADADRCHAVGRSGARTGAQRRSHELRAVDEQVPGPSGRGSGGQRAPHQEIGPGRDPLVEALEAKGHRIRKSALAEILHELGFSLHVNKKSIEGTSHPDRDAQFRYINSTCKEVEQKGHPIISVDCKKKELLGNFKNAGREWQAKGEETSVNVYDFVSLATGRAIPYGIYDLVHHHGFVNVGIDHDTAEFAVESIRRWWQSSGKRLYPEKKALLITADGGGSNGARKRLWKKKLQELANEEQLSITVAHYPPATSKWNKIEHRLFSFISINWRAKPLTSLEVVLELLSHTRTKEGLEVTAVKDGNVYPTGLKVTDDELAALNLSRHSFHGEWNYTIKPQEP